MAQLAERSLPISEDPGSNPAIGNFYSRYLLIVEKTNIKEKEVGNGTFLKKEFFSIKLRYPCFDADCLNFSL